LQVASINYEVPVSSQEGEQSYTFVLVVLSLSLSQQFIKNEGQSKQRISSSNGKDWRVL
jgi:hypothetical protein